MGAIGYKQSMRSEISIDETRRAVRLVYILMGVMLCFFGGLSTCYHPDAMMVEYGRETSHPWIMHKIRHLDMDKRRAHDGGKIVWLIGSSLIRESFDEHWLNDQLAIRGSEYRVIELGMDQANSILAYGMMKHVDLREGDLVLHNLSLKSYIDTWLDFTGLPAYQLMEILEPSDFWEIPEWTLADKLEQASAIPYSFYAFHNSYTNGLTWWFIHLVEGELPPKRGPQHYLTHYRNKKAHFKAPSPTSRHYIGADRLSFEEDQINRWGWSKMQMLAQESNVELTALFIPPRQQYMAEMVHPTARAQFIEYVEAMDHPRAYFPQLPEEAFYDLIHPNKQGRKVHSQYLLDWLNKPVEGTLPELTWPIPDYHLEPQTP